MKSLGPDQSLNGSNADFSRIGKDVILMEPDGD